jgi:hypothetical protein
MGGYCHAPVTLRLGMTRYPLYRRLGGPQGQSGRLQKISPPTEVRSLDHTAHSESLYRLSYPDPLTTTVVTKIQFESSFARTCFGISLSKCTVSRQFCVSLIHVTLHSPSFQYPNFPHERLLVSQQVSLVVALLTFCLQTGWLYLGISSTIDKTIILLWLGQHNTHGPIKIFYQNSKLTQLYRKLKITEGNNVWRMSRDRQPHLINRYQPCGNQSQRWPLKRLLGC